LIRFRIFSSMDLVAALFSSMTMSTCWVWAKGLGGAVALAPSRLYRAKDFEQNHSSEIALSHGFTY
jgi:hypothetical protein